MRALIVCFAPKDKAKLEKALAKLPCHISHWEVEKPFPPHVHLQSVLSEEQLARMLLPLQTIVYPEGRDSDEAKKSPAKKQAEKKPTVKKQTKKPGKRRAAGRDAGDRHRVGYDPDARLGAVGSMAHAHDFRDVDVPGASADYIHGLGGGMSD